MKKTFFFCTFFICISLMAVAAGSKEHVTGTPTTTTTTTSTDEINPETQLDIPSMAPITLADSPELGLSESEKMKEIFIEQAETALATQDIVQILSLLYEAHTVYPDEPLTQELEALIANMEIIRFSMPAETVKGTAFKAPFVVKVIWKDTKKSIANIPLEVSYPVYNKNGELGYTAEKYVSNENGFVSISPSVPEYPCNGIVYTRLDTGIADFPWTETAPYKVATAYRGKPGAISLVDYTKTGSPITNNSRSSSALLTAFVRRGFSRVGIADFTAPIVAKNDEGVYTEAKRLFGSSTQFLIYGTVKYEKAEQTTNGFTIALVADITALDLINKAELYKTTTRAEVSAKSEYDALEAARKTLFTDIVAEQLIYGM